MKKLALFTLFVTTLVLAEPPTRVMFTPKTATVITSTSTNIVTYATSQTNGVLTLSIPLTNAPISGCAGMLILVPKTN